MKKRIRDALVGLVLRVFRTAAFLVVCFAFTRRAPQDRTMPTTAVATQPLNRIAPAEAAESQRSDVDGKRPVLVRNIGPAG